MISDELGQKLWERTYNSVENECRDEEYRKQQEEQQRLMEEREKQRKERQEQEREFNKSLPERQLQMLLSGHRNRWSCCHMPQRAELYGHAKRCDVYTAIDIEPGLKRLRDELYTGEIIKRVVEQQAYNRLIEFGNDGEIWEHLINRLLDIATSGKKEKVATDTASTN